MKENKYFSDKSIIEQSGAIIRHKNGTTTTGVSIIVACPRNVQAIEVILDHKELKAALAEAEAARLHMPER